MKVKVYIENKILFSCEYIKMELYKSKRSRRIVFYNIKASILEKILQQIKSKEFLFSESELNIKIDILNKFGKRQIVYDFRLRPIEFEILNENTISFSGLLFLDRFRKYRQGVIDILYLWHKNNDIEWFSLRSNSPLKRDYFYCCFLYSDLSTKIIEKDHYSIDFSLIKGDEDVIYLMSLEFEGKKGYFGHNFHAFKDCFIEVYHHGGFKSPRKIFLINANKLSKPKIIELHEEIKELLVSYNFVVG